MMYKRLFAVMIIAIFLITSVGVISAAEDSISVKIIWDDNGNDRPSSVTVNLIKDGVVVDSAKLSSGNGWKTTFKVDDDGQYQVTEESVSDYSSSIYGNAKNGFIIKNHLINSDVLGTDDDSSSDIDKITSSDSDSSKTESPASDSDSSKTETSASDKNLSNSDNTASDTDNRINGSSPLLSDVSNGTEDDNSTNNDTNGTSNANSTDDSTDNSTDDSKSDKDSKDDSKTTTETTETTDITTTTKIIKQDNKKPENTTKSKNNHTGFPIVVLVIALFAAIFIPLNRKR